MADVEYQPDRQGMRGLMIAPDMHAMVTEVAADAIPFAQSISPDAPPVGGGYVDSFEVDSGHVERIARERRAVAHLYNTAEYAAAVEWGWDTDRGAWGNHPGHHVLSRTADHIEAQS